MKVSLIVPIYNVERYLRKCIDSLIDQKYADYEILLIDDGSTDTSSMICEEYSNKYNNIYTYHKVNGGLSSARNYGINKASGEWIIFVDSDDFWTSKDVIYTLLKTAKVHNADLVRFEYFAVDENDMFLYEHEYKFKKHIVNRSLSQYELFHYGIAGEFFSCLFMIRRDLIDRIKFNEELRFQEDVDFVVKLFALKQFCCAYNNHRFYAYRKRRNSLTSTPQVSNIIFSFTLADAFYDFSSYVTDSSLKQEYIYNSLLKYYRTLCTFLEPPYFKQRKRLLEQLEIEKYRMLAKQRMIKHRIFNKTSIITCIPSNVCVVLLYLYNKMKSFVSKK